MIQPFWIKVSAFLVVMFFILLSDAILSDFVPGYIQQTVGSASAMGLIMAFSSIVGIGMDLLFPQMLRGAGVRKLAGLAIVGSLTFLISLYFSTTLIPVLMLLLGMAAWGVYYELDAFMTKQFVADVAPAHSRGAVWGVVGVFRSLAYFLGPLLGASIAVRGDRGVIVVAGVVLLLAYLFFLFLKLPRGRETAEADHVISVKEEFLHWLTLGKRVWSVLIISLLVGIVDAVFWTTGTVVNDTLAELYPWGGWFLSIYMLPSLFVGFVIAKWGIYQGKKRWAEIFTLLGGLTLMAVTLHNQIWWILGVVFVASIFFGMSWPLIDATYSDFAVRMKRGRKHMIGISSSVLSLAYVIGPILAGVLAERVGELKSFVWVGGLVVVVSIWLLMVTPRKIRLPEMQIEEWDKLQ